jgi:predicted kinase
MTQLFVSLFGHNAAGKTTVAKRLSAELPFNRVSADDFRLFVSGNIPYFQDLDISFKNPRYDQLNPLAVKYRFDMTRILLEAGQNVIYDGSGFMREWRAKYLELARQAAPNCKTVIIIMEIGEEELLKRLEERTDSVQTRWVEQYHHKKVLIEKPTPDEADMILEYDQTNYDAIKAKLEELLAA